MGWYLAGCERKCKTHEYALDTRHFGKMNSESNTWGEHDVLDEEIPVENNRQSYLSVLRNIRAKGPFRSKDEALARRKTELVKDSTQSAGPDNAHQAFYRISQQLRTLLKSTCGLLADLQECNKSQWIEAWIVTPDEYESISGAEKQFGAAASRQSHRDCSDGQLDQQRYTSEVNRQPVGADSTFKAESLCKPPTCKTAWSQLQVLSLNLSAYLPNSGQRASGEAPTFTTSSRPFAATTIAPLLERRIHDTLTRLLHIS